MTIDALFKALDLDGDGAISRDELGRAAKAMGWHWPEAPLYAVLDRFALDAPLSLEALADCLRRIREDPRGPYGQVLNRIEAPAPRHSQDTALLIIDPQQSFTRGEWMRSIGFRGEEEVRPIRRAFDNCRALIARSFSRLDIMFTRCPFPPGSYAWDDGIREVLPSSQPYFIKPGNSVLWPETNGFDSWVRSMLDHGLKTLVMGGCTLNSCVRVSSIETKERFGQEGLDVVVDLDLSGARRSNHEPSSLFEGRSPVEAAIEEMDAAGVRVLRRAL